MADLGQALQGLGRLGELKINKLSQEERFAAEMTLAAEERKQAQDALTERIAREDELIAQRREREDTIMAQERKQKVLDRAEDKDFTIADREDRQQQARDLKKGQLTDVEKENLKFKTTLKTKEVESIYKALDALNVAELDPLNLQNPEVMQMIETRRTALQERLSFMDLSESDQQAYTEFKGSAESFEERLRALMDSGMTRPDAVRALKNTGIYDEEVTSLPQYQTIDSGYIAPEAEEPLFSEGTVGNVIGQGLEPFRKIGPYFSGIPQLAGAIPSVPNVLNTQISDIPSKVADKQREVRGVLEDVGSDFTKTPIFPRPLLEFLGPMLTAGENLGGQPQDQEGVGFPLGLMGGNIASNLPQNTLGHIVRRYPDI
jgi:hypothetical protein